MIDRPGPDAVSAELIAHRGFTVSRRGFEQEEVRAFLELVAGAVRALQERLTALEAEVVTSREEARNPDLDEDTLMRLVGEETGSILRSARGAAADMRARAETETGELVARAEREAGELRAVAESEAATLRADAERETAELRAAAEADTSELIGRVGRETGELRDTTEAETTALRSTTEAETAELRARTEHETGELRARAEAEAARVVDEARQAAGDLRTEAEGVVGRAEADAEQAATRIRATAQESADQLVSRARREAESLHQQAEHDRRLTVEGAQAVREKILGDLSRRRRVAAIQIEQLRAGRERLLQSYAVVRRTLEEVNDELHRADAEARDAAAEAGRRAEEGGADDRIEEDLLLADPEGAVVTVPDEAVSDEAVTDEAVAEEAVTDEAVTDEAVTDEAVAAAAEAAGPAMAIDVDAVGDVGQAPPGSAAAAPEGAAVDDLFARIRAGRQGAAGGSDAMAEGGGSGEGAVGTLKVDVARVEAAEVEAAEVEATVVEDDDLEPRRSYEEESWLQRRDSALGETETALTRKLKRALQDEQNDLLDRLRMVRGRPRADALLPTVAEQKGRFAVAATELIERGAQEGTHFALLLLTEMGSKVGPPRKPADVAGLVTELADGIVDPLRRRLEQAIEQSGDDEQSVLVEALGAAYREWKTQRVERLAGDVLAGAFARGSVHAAPRRATLRWVVDDVDGPCPDCDDNVLAGPLARTEPFPTGQFHPPAHAGCRCIVVPGLG